jgi:TRAP-type C4-dicarboxylate transport system permease small subunit
MPTNADLESSLQRHARRSQVIVGIGAGLVMLLFAAFLVYLGVTWEEPRERIGTRAVPAIAPITITIIGGSVAITGLLVMWRAVRRG